MSFLRYESCPRCRERGKDSRGDNLAVYRDGSAHCFSCSYHIHPHVAKRWEPSPEDNNNKIKRILPDDFTDDVPAGAWKWLLQYGLPFSYWHRFVGYSPKHQRLVFRVGDPLQFSIGRLLPEGDVKPTYGHNRKWHVWGDAHQHCEVFGDGPTVTLVEDLISAHKVGQVTQAIPLFGVNVFTPVTYYLRQAGKPINLWLDKDQEGTLHKKATNLNMLTGCPVNIISTDKDPKELGYAEISSLIAG